MDFLIPAGGDFLCSVPFCTSISTGLKITILAVAFWISAACLEPVLEKDTAGSPYDSNFSYEVFLVHHILSILSLRGLFPICAVWWVFGFVFSLNCC